MAFWPDRRATASCRQCPFASPVRCDRWSNSLGVPARLRVPPKCTAQGSVLHRALYGCAQTGNQQGLAERSHHQKSAACQPDHPAGNSRDAIRPSAPSAGFFHRRATLGWLEVSCRKILCAASVARACKDAKSILAVSVPDRRGISDLHSQDAVNRRDRVRKLSSSRQRAFRYFGGSSPRPARSRATAASPSPIGRRFIAS